MRRFLLILLLLAAIVYAFTQKYQVQTGRSQDGSFQLVMVDKMSGKLFHIVGKR